jgi:hypothetical protein
MARPASNFKTGALSRGDTGWWRPRPIQPDRIPERSVSRAASAQSQSPQRRR